MRAGKKKNRLNIVDIIFITYLTLIGAVLLFFNSGVKYPYLYSALHFIIIFMVIKFAPILERSKNKFLNFLRWWYPIILFTFNYREVDRFTSILTNRWYDRFIFNFEYNILGIHPSLGLERFITPALTELMKFNYFTYYFMVPVAAAALYFFRKRKHYIRFLAAVCIAFYLSYLTFIIFPVRGPRYEFYRKYAKEYTVKIGEYYGPHVAEELQDKETKALRGYLFTGLQDYIMRYGSMYGGCMPSSHIAVAFVSMVMMGFYVRKLFYFYLPSVALLSVSVVYNRYHYLLDSVAGILTGLLAIYLADILIKKYGASTLSDPPGK